MKPPPMEGPPKAGRNFLQLAAASPANIQSHAPEFIPVDHDPFDPKAYVVPAGKKQASVSPEQGLVPVDFNPFAPGFKGAAPATVAPSGGPRGDGSGVQALEISANLSPEKKAFLTALSGGESPGYNVKYGGGTFDDYSRFPSGGILITSGPNAGKTSSASGRYQFLEGTWNEQARKLGLKDFSPESQDAAAWDLAHTTYAKKSGGRDLEADIRDPNLHGQIGQSLSGVWTSLPGGIETNRAGSAFSQNLMQNLERYRMPAQSLADVPPQPW